MFWSNTLPERRRSTFVVTLKRGVGKSNLGAYHAKVAPNAFSIKITPSQSTKLFTAAKALHRSWTEHFLYLTAVSDACGRTDNIVLDYIVYYADPTMRTTMLSRLNLNGGDYLR